MIHLLRLLRLRLTLHKSQPLSRTQDSISTPLGHLPYKRDVNTHVKFEDGVERARNRSYAERGKHDE
jgi:hypothetical protein